MRNFCTKTFLTKAKSGLFLMACLLLGLDASATIIEFEATPRSCTTGLSWTTDGLSSVTRYDVMKSSNGLTYELVETVEPRGWGQTIEYYITTAQFEEEAAYRIIEHYRDGVSSVSETLYVKMACNNISDPGQYISQPAPNPIRYNYDAIGFIYDNVGNAQTMDVLVADITGRVLINSQRQLHSGENEITVKMSNLTPGTYLMSIMADGVFLKTDRIIVTQ